MKQFAYPRPRAGVLRARQRTVTTVCRPTEVHTQAKPIIKIINSISHLNVPGGTFFVRQIEAALPSQRPDFLVARESIPNDNQSRFSERSSAWLEHLVWDQDVAGSNPVAPTTFSEETVKLDSASLSPDLSFQEQAGYRRPSSG
jgi:hypothetical protein